MRHVFVNANSFILFELINYLFLIDNNRGDSKYCEAFFGFIFVISFCCHSEEALIVSLALSQLGIPVVQENKKNKKIFRHVEWRTANANGSILCVRSTLKDKITAIFFKCRRRDEFTYYQTNTNYYLCFAPCDAIDFHHLFASTFFCCCWSFWALRVRHTFGAFMRKNVVVITDRTAAASKPVECMRNGNDNEKRGHKRNARIFQIVCSLNEFVIRRGRIFSKILQNEHQLKWNVLWNQMALRKTTINLNIE